MLVDGNARDDALTEQAEHLAGLGVTAGRVLGVQEFAVDLDVEDTLAPGHQRDVTDDVLVVVEQVVHRAHGTVGIVSRNAVGQPDVVGGCGSGHAGDHIGLSVASAG
jgi:hypothetical protein